ncbi:CLUMA_CG002852, isoform A [Clunio marinus]|uniref:CLUMA_CG002852, isoform A n=1 Tax=Clunio marinus TaxID=568069 RepID=A0A1J1HL33_9DIPT|nr:CLUMA_CG002852, isoform A [Clunio marinus]
MTQLMADFRIPKIFSRSRSEMKDGKLMLKNKSILLRDRCSKTHEACRNPKQWPLILDQGSVLMKNRGSTLLDGCG